MTAPVMAWRPTAPRALMGLLVAQGLGGALWPALYRDPAWVRAAWAANDVVTLAVAPLVPVVARAAARGSRQARLAWGGLLGYALYNGAYYLLGAQLNVWFPLYVAITVLAGVAIARDLRPVSPACPRRGAAWGLAAIGVGLAVVWLAIWGAHVFLGRATPIEPEAFRLVAALDLTLMAPTLVGGGVLAARAHPWGRVLAAAAGVQGTLYLVVLAAGSAVAVARGLAPAPGEVPLWGALAVLTAGAAWGVLGAADERTSLA